MRFFAIPFSLAAFVILAATETWSQTVVENFNYPPGQLTDLNSGDNVSGGAWVRFSGTGNPVTVVEGNLAYPHYPSIGVGNMAEIRSVSSSAEDVYLPFATLPTEGILYVSLLLCVTDTTNLRPATDSIGDYFAALVTSTSTSNHVGRVSIRQAPSGNAFQLGIRASSQNLRAEWGTPPLEIDSTHLVVLRYTLAPGGQNDTVAIWIDPDLALPQSGPHAIQAGASTSEPGDLGRLIIRQDGTDTPDAYLDGIRIGRSWLESPLPIQLSALTAVRLDDRCVCVEWITQTEVQNYGFEVQRSSDQVTFLTLPRSFVPGAGSTITPQSYSFVDSSASSDPWFYRLVQHDLDGTMHYSDAVAITPVTSVDPGSDSGYGLFPNYPNPFNPSTDIRFRLERSGRALVQVFHLTGQLVVTLFDGHIEAGHMYSVPFSGSSYASGVYLCRLASGSRIETRPMILIK